VSSDGQATVYMTTTTQVITWIAAFVLLYIAVCQFAFVAWVGGKSS
jgi:hypothetical protein